MIEFDKGPPQRFAKLFATCPDYGAYREHFWYDWGPVFYRGRLDGSARVLCIASDPGATERIAGRTLVGDAGQRVQGFLHKLGLTRSYLCLNAFSYALYPSHADAVDGLMADPAQLRWRNGLFDAARGPALQAIVAFGGQAQRAVELWPGKSNLPVLAVPHPSSRDAARLQETWRAAVSELRTLVTPDADGDTGIPNYGATFEETDYRAIPRADLPFGVPDFLGDDSRGRPGARTSVSRPTPDDRHTLIWKAPGVATP